MVPSSLKPISQKTIPNENLHTSCCKWLLFLLKVFLFPKYHHIMRSCSKEKIFLQTYTQTHKHTRFTLSIFCSIRKLPILRDYLFHAFLVTFGENRQNKKKLKNFRSEGCCSAMMTACLICVAKGASGDGGNDGGGGVLFFK